MPLSDDDVTEILRIIDESKLAELRIETPEFRLHVRRGSGAAEEDASGAAEGAAPRAAAAAEPAPPADGAPTIDAPMLGTFYRAEAPGAAPFVEVGARVEEDTVVCLIEVMKMMNSIRAGMSGKIVEVCAENAQLVEFGQALFRVEP
jgi:acetyl-CoA carboxylase biotin carboxyl carrier protein